MKKIIFLLPLLLSFMGCSLDHDGDSQQPIYRLVPIVATNLPETFTAGETYEVEITRILLMSTFLESSPRLPRGPIARKPNKQG